MDLDVSPPAPRPWKKNTAGLVVLVLCVVGFGMALVVSLLIMIGATGRQTPQPPPVTVTDTDTPSLETIRCADDDEARQTVRPAMDAH
jgi:hypothetical protein